MILKIEKQIICTVKHADDFVLLAKEETVLQEMTAGLIQDRKIYAVKINWGERKISRRPSEKQFTIEKKPTRNMSNILVS